MNIKERLRHLATLSTKDRQTGRTSAICRIAKEIYGIVLAADFKQAKMLERQFGVTAKSIDINLDGYSGPFIMDHYAVERMFIRAADKIEELERENAAMKESIEYFNSSTKNFLFTLRKLKEEKQELKNMLLNAVGPIKGEQILKKKGYL